MRSLQPALPPTESADGEVPAVSRIVSLAPSNTEIAYYLGLGPQIVGVCDDSEWPPDARTKAKVGMDLQIDAEKVAGLHPDLILASLSVPGMEKCVADVRERGLGAIVLDPKSVENVLENIAEVARAAGVPGRGRALVATLREAFRRVERAVEGLARPTVFWEWWPRPLISPGGKSWMVDIVRIAGGRMLFGDEAKESLPIEASRVLEADPEVVVLCWVGAIAKKQDPAKVYERSGWEVVKAVQERRVFALPDVLFAAPGPRLVDGATMLAKVLHPEAAL
ncbi:MAG TPA: cobalamin-binding protein [Candidatus Thermoplasmatota archaeon]|nr:cobalamin-binding protein [Candidatus Thermoplasmatota archaeon]